MTAHEFMQKICFNKEATIEVKLRAFNIPYTEKIIIETIENIENVG